MGCTIPLVGAASPPFPRKKAWLPTGPASCFLWPSSVLCRAKFVLHVIYGFFVGVTFWDTPTNVDDRETQLAAACMWIIILQCYVHIFKVLKCCLFSARFSVAGNLS